MKSSVLVLLLCALGAKCRSVFPGGLHSPMMLPRLLVDEESEKRHNWTLHGDDCLVLANSAELPAPRQFSAGSSDCGIAELDRIVGGDEASIHKFPWMTALTLRGTQFCGGSVISHRYVLTAAHCIAWGPNTALGMDLVFLDHDLDSETETTVTPARRKVSKLKMHASYSASNLDYDIALIELDEPLDLGDGEGEIRPICLPEKADYTGELATVSGWGHLTYGGENVTSVLHEVQVEIVSNEKCEELYSPYEITDKMLCAGDVSNGGKDSCQGDSGGPLMLEVGIVSWGIECANRNYPGVYARVSELLEWIHKHTSEDEP